ncbi:MAG: hypothetical protein A2219_02505 [Elusimicrobia bacterium RIFOXYA2_FULL_50_26]|nr:MAG: hypothetical protein A2219_02505 [Elusimicrobia bacterium RIFOXYA2_FULL_50_26]OGS23517.1 MAG: hypothetical protein A2314_05685 [Elusimicrobia bacterium RIFOXYB2_FULL_50_12]
MLLIFMEVLSYVQAPLTALLFWKLLRRNVVGDLIAGTIIGMYIEFATEPLWDYHFVVTVYKDIPPGIVLGWGVLFTLAVFVSEKLYTLIFRRNSIIEYDKRIFITDLLAAPLVGLPLEKTGMLAGVWDYHYELLNWSGIVVPVFGMPLEALIGYGLLMLTGPTFVRYWQRGFERR